MYDWGATCYTGRLMEEARLHSAVKGISCSSTQQKEFALSLLVSLFNSTQSPVDEKSQGFHHRLNLATETALRSLLKWLLVHTHFPGTRGCLALLDLTRHGAAAHCGRVLAFPLQLDLLFTDATLALKCNVQKQQLGWGWIIKEQLEIGG